MDTPGRGALSWPSFFQWRRQGICDARGRRRTDGSHSLRAVEEIAFIAHEVDQRARVHHREGRRVCAWSRANNISPKAAWGRPSQQVRRQ